MLVAKISPAASFVSQSNPFGQPETTTADYIAVVSYNYIIGGSMRSSFQVLLGLYNPGIGEHAPVFKSISDVKVELTNEELASWGTDDKFILNAVAGKLGISIVEVIEEEYILGIL